MFFIEAISPEYHNYLLAFISAIIIYLGWRTTYVREERLHPTAVLIIGNQRRRFIDLRATNHPTGRSSSSQSNYSNATEEAETEVEQSDSPNENIETATQSLQSIIDEVNDLTISGESSSNFNPASHPIEDHIQELIGDIGQQDILDAMDEPETEGLRRRRLAFYENERTGNSFEAGIQVNRRENLNVHTTDQADNSHAENCTNENNENENISKTEIKASIVVGDSNEGQQPHKPAAEHKDDEFRIKLKYLNDELRLVKGTPNEPIGDFKKRNFTVELAAEKLVRLVFNGHVLQPDSKTLKACGLFDNCVVHCLVHNKKPSATSDSDANNPTQGEANNGQRTLGANRFPERLNGDVLFIYLGMAFIVVAMILSWYCRFQYGHLFSWYSTTGLVLMTVIFLIIFPIIVLIERGVTA